MEIRDRKVIARFLRYTLSMGFIRIHGVIRVAWGPEMIHNWPMLTDVIYRSSDCIDGGSEVSVNLGSLSVSGF